jgi:phage nucleotide-binding protein
MVVYGEGGVGKTTFAATAPRPIIADCENGSKYFGLRGIEADVALIEGWDDMQEFLEIALTDNYDTVIIDPIGELMEKLIRYMIIKADSKLVQKDGNPTMAGWGWLKQTMRSFLKVMRDSGKNVVIVAHVQEKDDEGRVIKRPMVATKLSEELVNMVDIVGYMTTVNDAETGETKRVIIVDPASDKFVAKDRTGRLGKYIEPDFTKIVDGVRGDKQYAWVGAVAKLADKEQIKQAAQPHIPNSRVEMRGATMGTSESDK